MCCFKFQICYNKPCLIETCLYNGAKMDNLSKTVRINPSLTMLGQVLPDPNAENPRLFCHKLTRLMLTQDKAHWVDSNHDLLVPEHIDMRGNIMVKAPLIFKHFDMDVLENNNILYFPITETVIGDTTILSLGYRDAPNCKNIGFMFLNADEFSETHGEIDLDNMRTSMSFWQNELFILENWVNGGFLKWQISLLDNQGDTPENTVIDQMDGYAFKSNCLFEMENAMNRHLKAHNK